MINNTRILLTVFSFFLATSFASADLILIDAGGGNGTSGGFYNNFTGPTSAPADIANLIDFNTGAGTGIGLTYAESAPDAGVAGSGANFAGPFSLPATSLIGANASAGALTDGLFIGAADVTLTLTGLNPTSTFDLEFFGSRGNNGSGQTFDVTGGGGTTSASIAAIFQNSTDIVSFTGLTPDGAGNIVIFLPNNGTGNGAVNVIAIDETPAVIPEPSSMLLLGLGGILMTTRRRR